MSCAHGQRNCMNCVCFHWGRCSRPLVIESRLKASKLCPPAHIWPTTPFCKAAEQFLHVSMVEKTKRRAFCDIKMTWNSNYSAHKVLLKHSHLTGLRISYGCVPATPAELSSCDRDHVAYKAKLFTNWVFNEKVCQLQIQPISLFASRLLLEKDVKTKFDDENSTLREIQTKWIMLRGQLGMCRDWDIPWEAGLERSFGEVRGPSMIQRAAMKKEGKNNSLWLQEIDWGLKNHLSSI